MSDSTKKFLSLDGLSHLWAVLKTKFDKKVDKEFKTGSTSVHKVLSDNNLTDALVEKINNAGDSTFSGNYEDLNNIPSTFTPTTHTHAATEVTGLSSVATSGSYNDLNGTPEIPTNNNQLTNGAGYQTAEQVNTIVQNIVGAAPDALNTLKELADALGNDANFAATITTELGKKLNITDLVAITNEEIDTICV